MAHKAPINIRGLQKTGILNEDRFFLLLAQQCNYVDAKTVRQFYLGLVRYITKELRKNGVARLPHLGDFALVKQKDKLGLVGRRQMMVIGKYVLKFYAKEAWRQYFSKLQQSHEGRLKLDPRERILNQKT